MHLCDYCEDDFRCCFECNSLYCSECADLDHVDAAAHCGGQHCPDHCSACAAESTECVECNECLELHHIAPKLLARNEHQAVEIVEMRNSIDALTNENEQLRREIDELRKRKRDD